MKKTAIAIFIGITLIILGGCMKQSNGNKPSEAQISFLKQNEPLITEYVKTISDDSPNKITSVTYVWDDTILAKSDGSNITLGYDTLVVDMYVNDDAEQGVQIWIRMNDFKKLDTITQMGVAATNRTFFDLYDVKTGEIRDGYEISIPWKEYRK